MAEDRYRILSELVTDYLYVLRVQSDGEVVREWANDAFTLVTGYSLPEVDTPGAWQALVVPDDLPIAFEHVVRLIAGEAHEVEYRIRTRAGKVRWLRDKAQPVRDAAGRVERIFGAARDVTAEREGRERTAFLAEASVILDSSLDYADTLERVARLAVPRVAESCVVDLLEDGELRTVAMAHVDPAVQTQHREVRRSSPPSPDDPESAAEVARTGRAMVVVDAIRGSVHPEESEIVVTRRRLGLASVARVPLQARGHTLGVLSFGTSQPDRRFAKSDLPFFEDLARRAALAVDNARLYRALQSAERRYHGLFESSADAMLVVDDRGRIVEANVAALRMLDYEARELLERRAWEIAVGPAGWAEREFESMREHGGWRGEVELIRADGRTVPVEVHTNVLDLAEGRFYLSVVRDISERRAAERVQREFLAMIGHELRNPLAALRGYTQLMKRRAAYSEQTVDVIIHQVDRLDRLITDLVDASRLERGRIELDREPVDLASLARAAAVDADAQSEEHTVRVEGPESLPPGYWDHARIDQVLQNLISNAIKYAPPGEILVRVEDRGEEAQVSVIDRGPGIPADDLPRIFERFYRSDKVVSNAAGLGLGLYICRGLVEQHGGRIWVESTLGRGSTFSFVLPYGQPA